MTSCGALRSFPSRIMMESPFIFKASNHRRTLFPSAKVITHVQLGFPGRVNNCGDDVIIPWGSVSRHPHEQEVPDSVYKSNFLKHWVPKFEEQACKNFSNGSLCSGFVVGNDSYSLWERVPLSGKQHSSSLAGKRNRGANELRQGGRISLNASYKVLFNRNYLLFTMTRVK